jgi:hypothetical protein
VFSNKIQHSFMLSYSSEGFAFVRDFGALHLNLSTSSLITPNGCYLPFFFCPFTFHILFSISQATYAYLFLSSC